MTSDTRLTNLLLQYEELADAGMNPQVDQLCQDCPELIDTLTRRLAVLEELRWLEPQNKTRYPGAVDSPILSCFLVAGTEPIPGYQLIRPLGQGGFGQVWQAEGPGKLQVALKFIPLGGRQEEYEQRAFATIKDIRHPYLLSVIGIWTTATHLVIGMELAEQTLADRLKYHQQKNLPGLPLDEAHRYLKEAAAGLMRS